jgi:glutamate N-acetyltransferase / amino-acid N-acetyltransferase
VAGKAPGMTVLVDSSKTIHLPEGFSFSAVAAGLKASRGLDLALVEAVPGTNAAALFTTNRVVAAPIPVGRAHLATTRGRVRALIVNSGNANCATGKAGLRACTRICHQTARLLHVDDNEVFPSSTGIIGVPMPVGKILEKLPELIAAREATEQGIHQFARAIMTTDTRPKLASARFLSGNSEVRLLGIAKGSGMIHPQLATMLVYLFTDMAGGTADLKRLLHQTCDQTLNCISVDGDTSTNDTVLLLANGGSGVRLRDPSVRKKFENALLAVCQSLAEQIICDGEGVQHVIQLFVEQAKSREEALQVARAVAHSLLVKTAWAGADPNWGRILAAVGRCGLPIDPKRIDILIGNQLVCRRGVANSFDETNAHQALSQPRCDIRIRLQRGRRSAAFLTTDLTAEYVRINADYST